MANKTNHLNDGSLPHLAPGDYIRGSFHRGHFPRCAADRGPQMIGKEGWQFMTLNFRTMRGAIDYVYRMRGRRSKAGRQAPVPIEGGRVVFLPIEFGTWELCETYFADSFTAPCLGGHELPAGHNKHLEEG